MARDREQEAGAPRKPTAAAVIAARTARIAVPPAYFDGTLTLNPGAAMLRAKKTNKARMQRAPLRQE